MPLMQITSLGPSHWSCFFFFVFLALSTDQWWLVEVKGEWKTVPNGSSYLSQETTSAQRSPSVGHVSTSLSVPSQRRLAAKKKKNPRNVNERDGNG